MTREEAIGTVRRCCPRISDSKCDFESAMRVLVPELRESEDERIRKEIISALKFANDGGVYDKHIAYLEKQKEQKPIIQDVELNDAVYDYVRDHFIAGADFTPEYIKKLMENAFFAGVDYYLLKQESESCEPDTNVEKVIEDVIRVYGKTQGEWVGGYDIDTLIVNLRRAFNKKEQKPADLPPGFYFIDLDGKKYYSKEFRFGDMKMKIVEDKSEKSAEWSEEDEKIAYTILNLLCSQVTYVTGQGTTSGKQFQTYAKERDWFEKRFKSLRPQPKQEWSEEDKAIVGCIAVCLDGQFVTEAARKQCLEWFNKHRRDFLNRPSWKPSEEQIKILSWAANGMVDKSIAAPEMRAVLRELYEQLKSIQ